MDGSSAAAEKSIEVVLKNVFTSLHVWRNPEIVKGTKRRELTDVVAFFNQTGYLFESKLLTTKSLDDTIPDNFEKRIAKAIRKASRQLKGAYRQVALQGMPFGPIANWRAIIVLVTPFVDVFKTPSVLQQIDSPNTIHYISFHDFLRIVHFFDTPTDFEGYLNFREQFYSIATSRNFQLRPPENDLISFNALVTAYSPNPTEHFARFFSKLQSIEPGAGVLLLSGEEFFVNRRKDLQLLRREREQFHHVDTLIENVLNTNLTHVGPTTVLAKWAARFNLPINVPMNKDSTLILCSYLAQLDRRTRILIGKLLEQTMLVSGMSPHTSAAFIIKVADFVYHFFTTTQLTEFNENLFHVNTMVAKYGMKTPAICGVGYFGRTIDESEFRVVYLQEDWKYNEFMQSAWNNNPYFDTDHILHQKMIGLTLPAKFKIRWFRKCPCGSGRIYLSCHRFKRQKFAAL